MKADVINAKPYRRNAFLVFFTVFSVLVAVYWGTLSSMVEIWARSETFMHGFLIAPISLWLILRKSNQLKKIVWLPQKGIILILCAIVFIWLLGQLADVQVVMQFAFVAMMPTLVWLFFGKNVVKEIAFPLVFLFFAVPAGEFLVPYLQDITANITVNALRLTGISVFREGNYFNIPSGSFEIAVACSGVRYLIASLALGALYAYLTYCSYWRRMLFIAVSLIVPVIANGVRAYVIVMLAHLSDYKLATGVDHLVYGWLFFGIVVILMFWVGSYFREDCSPDNSSDYSKAPSNTYKESNKPYMFLPLMAMSVLIAGPTASYWLKNMGHTKEAVNLNIPEAINGWKGPYLSDATWAPANNGAHEVVSAAYKKQGKIVYVHLAYYTKQDQGTEMINAANKFYSGNWRKIRDKYISAKDGKPMREIIITSTKGKIYLRQWYLIDGEAVVSPIWAKFYEARSRLFQRNPGSYTVLLGVDSFTDVEANDSLNSFLTEMWPHIRDSLLARHA